MIRYFLYSTNFELPFDGERLEESAIMHEVIYRDADLISIFDNENDARNAMDSYVSYAQVKPGHGWGQKIWCGKIAFIAENHWKCECSEDDEEFENYETANFIEPKKILIDQPFASSDLDRSSAYEELDQQYGKVELYGKTYYLLEEIPEGDDCVEALQEDGELVNGQQDVLYLQCKDGEVVDLTPFCSCVITWDDDGTFKY